MNRSALLWAVLGTIYAVFFSWYTSCEGPLTPEEITHYVRVMEQGDGEPERIEVVRRFLEEDTGDDFVMLNLIALRERPRRVEGVGPDETADEVLGRYMEYMWPALLSRASHPVAGGRAASDALEVWGVGNAESWTVGAMIRYRSRRDLMEIASNPDFQGPHGYKEAAILKTVAFAIDPWFHFGDPRLLLLLSLALLGAALQRFVARGAA